MSDLARLESERDVALKALEAIDNDITAIKVERFLQVVADTKWVLKTYDGYSGDLSPIDDKSHKALHCLATSDQCWESLQFKVSGLWLNVTFNDGDVAIAISGDFFDRPSIQVGPMRVDVRESLRKGYTDTIHKAENDRAQLTKQIRKLRKSLRLLG